MQDLHSNYHVARILICEYEDGIAGDIAGILTGLGYEVAGRVSTGQEAVRKAGEAQPDLILMDIKLRGEIDGIQASEQVRARFDIPVIFLTAPDEIDVISEATAVEPYGFLAKPVSGRNLRTTIEAALYKHAADKRLRESEERYRTLVEQSIDGIVMVQGMTVRFVNSALARMFGFQSPEQMEGQNFLTFVAPEYRDLMKNRGLEREEGELFPTFYEFRALRKDGKSFIAELSVNLTTYHGARARQGIIRDITERKKAEEAIRQSEIRRAKAEELANLFSWEWDIGSGRLVRSEASYRTFGFRPGVTELHIESFINSVHADDRYLVRKALLDAAEGVRSYDVEFRVVRPDGEERVLASRGELQRDEKGRAIRILGMTLDITDRKRAEQALRRSEFLLKEAQRVAHIGHWEIESPNGTPIWSEELFHIFGLDPDRGEPSFAEHQAFIHPEDWELANDSLTRGAVDGVPFDIELRFFRPDQSMGWINTKGYPTSRKKGGEFFRMFGTIQDITGREKAEISIRYERERFQTLSDSAPFGMVVISKDGSFEYVNPKFTEIFGYDSRDVPNGREWFRKAYPDTTYRQEVMSRWLQSVTRQPPGEARPLVWTVNCKDGSQKVVNFRPVKLDTGECFMTCEDITDRKRSEKALQVTLQRFYTILSNMYAGALLVAEDGVVEFSNEAFCHMWDLDGPPASLHGLKSFAVIQKIKDVLAKPAESLAHLSEILAGKRPGKSREVSIRGGRTYLTDFIPILIDGKRYGRLWYFQDITNLKRTEEALREANEILSTFADQLPAIVFIKDHNSRAQYMNNYMKEMLDSGDWIGRDAHEYFPPDVAEAVLADDKKALSHGPILREEWIPDKKGEMRLWETRKFPIFRAEKPPLLGGVSIDITTRKEAEERLEQEKAISDSIIDSLPGTFYLFDDELKFIRWNKNLEKLTGYSGDEISAMAPLDFFAEKDKARIHAAIEKILTEGAFSLEANSVTKGGSEAPYWFNSKLLRFHEKRYVLGLGIDLTARKVAENALKASLEEKEILLREIHHRVKNNLQLISSLLRMQLRQIKSKDEGLVDAFEDIQRRIKAMALVHEALYQSENFELVDVPLYIQRIVANVGASFFRSREDLRIETDVKSITFNINVALACGLIVNELVTNSLKHAFPGDRKGEVVVTLESNGEAQFQLTVRDNGVGMPKHIDAQHPESLGLELVTDLARQLNGTVEFVRGGGTEVRVRFLGAKQLQR